MTARAVCAPPRRGGRRGLKAGLSGVARGVLGSHGMRRGATSWRAWGVGCWAAVMALGACGGPGERAPPRERWRPVSTAVVAARDRLPREACEGCHPGGAGPTPGLLADGPARAMGPPHERLEARHGRLPCRSCHAAPAFAGWSAEGRLDNEALSGGCRACHGRVEAAWREGWHGRARGGWAPRARLRDACVTCHDPHAPAPARRPGRMADGLEPGGGHGDH
jgi:hypothetical protein